MPETEPARRAAVTALVNRGAGTVRQGGLTEAGLRAAFRAAGVEAEVRFLDGPEIGPAAREAVARGAEAVVAGGGDGTIRTVAGALAGTEVPMGVLPVGTLNHFARDLGIPLAVEEAAAVVARGAPRALDLGEVNGEVFVNNSVLGFYPPVVAVRDQVRKRFGHGKWRATAAALLELLPRLVPLGVKVEVEGRAVFRRTLFVFVGNNEYQMNAFSYGARSRFDSGDLYLYIARPETRLGTAGLAALALVRDVARSGHFDAWCVPELTIDSRKKAMPVYLDGEVLVLEPPLRYRVRPHDLRVLVPG